MNPDLVAATAIRTFPRSLIQACGYAIEHLKAEAASGEAMAEAESDEIRDLLAVLISGLSGRTEFVPPIEPGAPDQVLDLLDQSMPLGKSDWDAAWLWACEQQDGAT